MQVEDHWRRLSSANEDDIHKSNKQLVYCDKGMYDGDLRVLWLQHGMKLVVTSC